MTTTDEKLLSVLEGDWLEQLRALPDESIQCCITSPPYFGLRDYGVAGQLGLEKNPNEYVSKLTAGFREVRRVIKSDGTLWLNLGDSYSGSEKGGNPGQSEHIKQRTNGGSLSVRGVKRDELKPKDLIGIPWRVAFALQADGWYLRQWIPWVKRNSMPESVTDRPASACESIFLLSKSQQYFYDHEAVRLPASLSFLNDGRWKTGSKPGNAKNGYSESKAQNPKSVHRLFDKQRGHSRKHAGFNERWDSMEKAEQCGGWRSTRNSDWFFEGMLTDGDGWPVAMVVNLVPFRGAHFATFPAALVRPCVMAGSRGGDTVLDPFGGSGTTGMVALELGRKAVLIELNPEYVKLIRERCDVQNGLPL